MLEILNMLKPFFEDTHREYSTREYGRIGGMSPPTASSFLKKAEKEGLVLSRRQGIYIYYRANRESSFFKDLARAYWRRILKALLDELSEVFLFKKPILFGSIAKCENTGASDVDIFIDVEKRDIPLEKMEKKLKRNVQFHFKESLKNENLRKNIEHGLVLE